MGPLAIAGIAAATLGPSLVSGAWNAAGLSPEAKALEQQKAQAKLGLLGTALQLGAERQGLVRDKLAELGRMGMTLQQQGMQVPGGTPTMTPEIAQRLMLAGLTPPDQGSQTPYLTAGF